MLVSRFLMLPSSLVNNSRFEMSFGPFGRQSCIRKIPGDKKLVEGMRLYFAGRNINFLGKQHFATCVSNIWLAHSKDNLYNREHILKKSTFGRFSCKLCLFSVAKFT